MARGAGRGGRGGRGGGGDWGQGGGGDGYQGSGRGRGRAGRGRSRGARGGDGYSQGGGRGRSRRNRDGDVPMADAEEGMRRSKRSAAEGAFLPPNAQDGGAGGRARRNRDRNAGGGSGGVGGAAAADPNAFPPPAVPLPPSDGVFPPPLRDLTRHSLLGEGDAGVAYLEFFKGSLPVAVKYVKLGSVEQDDLTGLRNELLNLRKLEHPNILMFLTAHACPTHLAIITEHVLWQDWKPKTLLAWLQTEHPRGVSEAEARGVFAQLASAVCHAHAHAVVHRDINPHNILLQLQRTPAHPQGRPVVKLCDFGASKECRFTVPSTFRCTAPEFVPPETLYMRHLVAHKLPVPAFSNKGGVDVWACGVVLLTMLRGAAPFSAATRGLALELSDTLAQRGELVDVMQRVLASPEVAPKVSPPLRDLLLRIFVAEPDARLTAADMAAHPWVAAQGYVPQGDYMADIAARYGRQSQVEFDALLQRLCGDAGSMRAPMAAQAPPGYVYDQWGHMAKV